MMMMSTTSSNQNPNVFTASQWEELEQQALIYKYMVSGVPVPTDLILSVRRSLYNTSASSLSNQHTSSLGIWEAGSSFPYNQLYQIGGYGGRKIDLEPGRCRRTDGKKWRCSKEAYPDSKYCERHMHRGRNRSRKPVEFSSSSSSSSSAATSVNNVSSSSAISKSIDAYPPPFSTFMDSSSYSHQTLKDYRQMQGMKDLGEDERSSAAAYFQLNDPYTTTTQSGQQNYSHFSFQNLKDEQQKKEQGQHCFVMGTDFIKPSEEHETTKSTTTKVDETTSKQPFHHFFSPPKATLLNPNPNPNWGEVDHPKAPLSTQDLFQSKPRPYW
ncbi:putative transcription factor interactor and regulator C3H-WRC/GRF family [Helianthus annuus]|nr:putative transcription factor interactor and regulator C3H-WRC/GRF family [Helianthus annuus]